MKLQEAIKQSDEEIQSCACEFMALIDSVSKYKEHMQSKVLEMKNDVLETAGALSNAYKGSWPAEFGNILQAKALT